MSKTLMNIKSIWRNCLTGILAIAFALQGWSQALPDYRRLATQYFNSKQYYAAAEYYRKALGIDESTRTIQFPYYTSGKKNYKPGKKSQDDERYLYYQLAESYRLYNDYVHAQPIYEKLMEQKDENFPIARLWLGVSLRANGYPERAKSELDSFLNNHISNDEYRQRAQLELSSCNFTIDQKKYPVNIRLTKLNEPINSAGSNYRLQWISNNNVQFTSSRPVKTGSGQVEYPSRILQGPYSGASLTTVLSDKNIETAAATISEDGLSLYVTGWKKNAGKNKTYGIYRSVRTSLSSPWPEPLLLPEPVNIEPFNSKEPFVTTDGRYLLFASDRPGGLGQYDLYWIALSGREIRGRAVNMGKTINTPLLDEAPFYDGKTRELFFSSNGRVGLGGLDIYHTVGEFSDNDWEEPLNMGISVNSIKDDLYFTRYNNKTYISSDRQSLCCLELFEVKPLHSTFTIQLIDCETGKRIRSENSGVYVYDSTEKVLQASKDMSGIDEYSFMMGSVGALKVVGIAQGYDTAKAIWRVKMVEAEDSSSVLRLCMNKKINLLELEYKKITASLPGLTVGYDSKEISVEYHSTALFEKEKYKLTAAGKKTLDGLIKVLKEYPRTALTLNGFIDYTDSAGFNDYVSWEMAYSVYDYLISQGVNGKNMNAPRVNKIRTKALGAGGKNILRRRVTVVVKEITGEN